MALKKKKKELEDFIPYNPYTRKVQTNVNKKDIVTSSKKETISPTKKVTTNINPFQRNQRYLPNYEERNPFPQPKQITKATSKQINPFEIILKTGANVGNNIGKTIGNIGINIGKTFLKGNEITADAITFIGGHGINNIRSRLGFIDDDEYRKNRDAIDIEIGRNKTKELMDNIGLTSDKMEKLDKGALIKHDTLDRALKTGANMSVSAAKGAAKTVEGWYDTLNDWDSRINDGLAHSLGIISDEEYKRRREKVRQNIAVNGVDEGMKALGWDEEMWNQFEDGSLSKRDNMLGQVSESVGGMVPTLIVGQAAGLGDASGTYKSLKGLTTSQKIFAGATNFGKATLYNLPSNLSLAGGVYGNSLEEAYANGATDSEAAKYAIMQSATEIATEWVTGGVPGLEGTGLLDRGADFLIDKATGKIKKEAVKSLVKTLSHAGYEMVGEGVEEALSEILSPIIKNATYSEGEKINWDDVVSSAIIGGVTGGFLNLPGTVHDVSTSIKGNSVNEQNVIDKVVENKINESEQNGKILSEKEKNEIRKEVQNDLDNGNISVEEIESALGGETYQKYSDNQTNINNIQNQISKIDENLSKNFNTKEKRLLNVNDYNELQNKRNTLEQQLEQLKSDSNTIGMNLTNEVYNLTKNDSKIQSSYYDASQKSKSYSYEKTNKMNNSEIAIRDSAINKINNTKSSQKLVDTVVNLSKSNGLNYRFTNNAELKKLGYDIKNRNINGVAIKSRDGNTIYINVSSENAVESIIGHETTHFLENKEGYSDFQKALFELAKENNDYDSLRNELTELYKDVSDADIDAELTAELTAKYLFSDDKFINRLTKNRTTFEKIKDFIDDLVMKFKGTAEEKKLKELQKKFKNINKANLITSKNVSTNQNFNSTKVDSKKLPVVKKENIPVDEKLLNKYSNVKEIFNGERNNYDGEVELSKEINELENVDLNNIKISDLKDLAANIFNCYNSKNIFENNGNKITVSKTGINESIEKIYNNEAQRNLMKEHLQVFSDLGDIIEHATLVNQTPELKNRSNIRLWNYYFDGLKINNDTYYLEFDVRSMDNGENQYRVQRLEKSIQKTGDHDGDASSDTRILPSYDQPVSISNDITNKPKSQIAPLPTNNNMQDNGNNTQGLENNSSFSFDESAKRYEDLKTTNKIEFSKTNDNIQVSLIDSNNNLVNQFNLLSNNDSVKQLGKEIGDYIFKNAIDDSQTIYINNDINNLETETDYFMNHRPTETGITADNLINQNVETPMPLDMYEHPEHYFATDSQTLNETMQVLNKVRNNPNAKITIYRATTGNNINEGDWVTLSRKYAEQHNQSNLDGKGNIVSLEVRARDIQFAGDDLNEFGYFPNNNDMKNSQTNNYSLSKDANEKKNNLTYSEDIEIDQIAPLKQEIKDLKNTIKQLQDQLAPLPNKKNSVLNPNEISQLNLEDANTTPVLPAKKINGKDANKKSKFYSNVTNKTKSLTKEARNKISTSEDVEYYKGITNEESLTEAKRKLDENGSSEALRWAKNDSNSATATDIAEGWILLKQYQDAKDYDSMVEVAKKMREIGTKAGQTVQAFNIMQRLTPEGMVKYAQSELMEAFNNMSKNKTKKWIDANREKFQLDADDVQFIIDTMNEVQTMEDGYEKKVKLAEIQKLMTDKLPSEKGAGFKSWMRISMLFNPKTQVRNVAGNALIAPVNSFGDLFASYADKLISKKTGVRTTGMTNIKSYLNGMKKGVYEATNDYRKGINTKDMEGNRFEIGEGKAFNERTLIGKGLNRVDGLLNYMMDAGDRVFSQAAFENSLRNQMVLNNTTEATQEMIDIARTESLQRTWNDNNGYTKFVLDVRRGLNKLNVHGYGLGDVLIPFAKTPANLTKAIIDYSPVGLIQTINDGVKLKKSLSNGQYTAQMQHKFVQDLGKATAGTMLYVLGYALAKAGILSGESDDDKDVSNFMKNTLGVSSYSINIGGKSFSYDWAQPLAAPFSIMSNINQKQKEGASLLENLVSSLDTAGSILLEQSFLDSLNTVFSNNDGVVTGIEEAVLELPSRAVPTFLKQITDIVDGTQRQTFEYDKPLETAINKVKAKIPFLSQELAPTIDTMGREVKKYGGKNNIFNVFINPANVNTENVSASAAEIYRLYKSTGNTNIMPRVAPYYINKKGEKITLSSSQRAEYQKASGDIIESEINKLLTSYQYQDMDDARRAEVINDIVNYSYNVAQKQVLGVDISDTYMKAYEYDEIGDISDYYSFKNSIDNSSSENKKESIVNYLLESDLNDKQLGYLYGNYYSNQGTIDMMINANIPIRQFIQYDAADFEGDIDLKTGKTISGSKKNKVINYVNSLALSIPQKALLIKMKYKSFDDYDYDIANYVNSLGITFMDKARILKGANFDSYDKEIVNYVNTHYSTMDEKIKVLKEMGFKVINGNVYY